MLKKLWLSVPVSLFCVLANAQTVTTASSTPNNTLAPAKSAAKPAKPAVAAAPAAATSATEAKKEEEKKASFSLDLGMGYETQVQKQADGSRSEELTYTIMPGMSYGDYTISMFNLYIQDLKDTGSTGSFIDPNYLFSRKGWTLNEYFRLSPSGVIVLPMTETSKNNGLLYIVGGALSLSLQTKALGLDAWSMSYYVGYNRNMTQFSTNAKGDPYTAYRLRQRINVGYKFTDSLSLATRFEFDANYSAVEAGVVKNAFYTYQTLSYSVNDNVSVSFGHNNAGAALTGPNYENNIKLFNPTSSTYSLGVDLSL